MMQSFVYSKEKLEEWQSSACMIPVLLGLLQEKFIKQLDSKDYLSMKMEISAYKAIFRRWEKEENLNPKQKEWVQEIGDYLNAIQQTFFGVNTQKRQSSQPRAVVMNQATPQL